MGSLFTLAGTMILARCAQAIGVAAGLPIGGAGFWAGILFMLAMSVLLNSRPPAGESL